MKPVAVLTAAVVIYVVAAWMVAPGFYDGFGSRPYNFTCPPSQAGKNQKPNSGHVDIKVIDGKSDANAAITQDGLAAMDFLPGVFDASSQTSISVDVKPLATCPQPDGLTFVTNVYCVMANAPLVKDAILTMAYSSLLPDPSAIYYASGSDGPWTSIGALPQAAPFMIGSRTRAFGYFAAGYPASRSSGGQNLLPIVVAVLIAAVLLAGVPLEVVRRRRGTSEK